MEKSFIISFIILKLHIALYSITVEKQRTFPQYLKQNVCFTVKCVMNDISISVFRLIRFDGQTKDKQYLCPKLAANKSHRYRDPDLIL